MDLYSIFIRMHTFKTETQAISLVQQFCTPANLKVKSVLRSPIALLIVLLMLSVTLMAFAMMPFVQGKEITYL